MSDARVIYAPTIPSSYSDRPSVFLAGSIEMGTAEPWQDRLIDRLSHMDVQIYNPRRPDWDSSWVQSKDNPQFREQVEWELSHLAWANVAAFYFDPNTKSPITLMELGLMIPNSKVVLCCPPGFWRKGNVDIVAERWGVPVWTTFDAFADAVVAELMWRCL